MYVSVLHRKQKEVTMGKFGDAAMDFGFQTAQGIVGAGMGLLMQKGQDKRQLR